MSETSAPKGDSRLTCEGLLRIIAGANPPPWYPRLYAQTTKVDRHQMEELLQELRLSGIIQLTDWEKGKGQGYRITEYGDTIMANPAMMERLKGPFEAQTIKLKLNVEPPTLTADQTTAFERGEIAREAMLSSRKLSVTKYLILANVIAFLLCLAQSIRWQETPMKFFVSGDAGLINRMGGLSAAGLAKGDWYLLISYGFLHYGITHLAMNMFSLYLQGRFLETAWGSARFLVIYLLSVIGGGTASMINNPGPVIGMPIMAGASAGIWGLMVSYLVWVILNRKFIPEPILRSSLQIWSVSLILNFGISYLPHVSFWGHVGGGIAGGITSLLLYLNWHYSLVWKRLSFIALTAMPFCFVGLIYLQMRYSSDWLEIVSFVRKSS